MSTAPYSVGFTKAAQKQLDALPAKVRARIAPRVAALADDPRPHGCLKLEGFDNLYRIRVGDYRVLYEISDIRLTVLVVRVAPRGKS